MSLCSALARANVALSNGAQVSGAPGGPCGAPPKLALAQGLERKWAPVAEAAGSAPAGTHGEAVVARKSGKKARLV